MVNLGPGDLLQFMLQGNNPGPLWGGLLGKGVMNGGDVSRKWEERVSKGY